MSVTHDEQERAACTAGRELIRIGKTLIGMSQGDEGLRAAQEALVEIIGNLDLVLPQPPRGF